MAKTTIDYKLNIKPQIENLDSLKKNLQSLSAKTEIFDAKTITRVNEILHSIESVQKLLSTKVGTDGLIDLDSFKQVKSEISNETRKYIYWVEW